MPYHYDQLLAWYESVHDGPLPAGTTSLGVDREAGVLQLVLGPEHDEAAVQQLLGRLPEDAVRVEVSTARWFATGSGATD